VRDMTEFTRAVQYIHRNPVERGLVERRRIGHSAACAGRWGGEMANSSAISRRARDGRNGRDMCDGPHVPRLICFEISRGCMIRDRRSRLTAKPVRSWHSRATPARSHVAKPLNYE
jgi:hypothetical protein